MLELIDGQSLMQAALAGYLSASGASGAPTDAEVSRAERMAAPGLLGPVRESPLYYGVPWVVPGPVSGAPYYADRPTGAWGAVWR